MKVLYTVTSGTADPTRASVGLHMAANGSLEVGHDVFVLFAGDGVEVVLGDNAERMEGVGIPPMRDLLAKLSAGRATVFV